MSRAEAASLTGALLAAKGEALPSPEITPIMASDDGASTDVGGSDMGGIDDRFVVLATKRSGATEKAKGGSGRPPRPPGTERRVKASVKLDTDLHRRLRIATSHLGESMQEFLVAAAERHLDHVMPALQEAQCGCIAPVEMTKPANGPGAPGARKTA